MIRNLSFLAMLCLATGVATADITMLPAANLPGGSGVAPYASLYGGVYGAGRSVSGDTYGAAPLVQDAASAFFISDAAPSAHTFDGLAEGAGNNLAQASGGTFSIIEAETATGPNTYLIQVEMTALDATGAPQPWVAAGVTGPAGPFTAWRLDVGSNAGGTDKISPIPNPGFSVLTSGFTVFNSAGAPLGSFGLTVDSSDASGVSGVGVVGLGGADIAGFDLASIQMFWEIQEVPEPAAFLLLSLGAALLRRR